VLELALVVVVGRADERASEPRQREDRASAARRDDRAADERQILLAQDQVRAAAGTNAQLRLVVELFGAQPIGPHAGRVDHVRRAQLQFRAALGVARAHAPRAAVALEQPGDVHAVGADRAEAFGLAEHRQHEPHVVGLAVVEQVAARRLARGERGQQLEHLLA